MNTGQNIKKKNDLKGLECEQSRQNTEENPYWEEEREVCMPLPRSVVLCLRQLKIYN